ncbi:uncharacterized protein HaLaN_07169 [Haematococcus lacustris]|uniref:Uncharacterized protein n=1 Tax=Haematococcus lacustris TaxID=44745 RepID=A0A699YMW6_HAELA|nr:uncharacterized protein HaLaN_07169 [Haematococcus lacustris]
MLVWHLMHCVAAGPAARLSGAEAEGVQLLADMLEDSPAGSAYQGVVDGLTTEFLELRTQLSASTASSSGLSPLALAALRRVLARPSAFALFCWAHHAVQQAQVLYELYICPEEQDRLCKAKLALLAAAGLGCSHHLTCDLSTEPLVSAALKVCLATKSLLSHSLAAQLEAVHTHVTPGAHALAAATSGLDLGGCYSPLGGSTALHQGVLLYLQGLVEVLDEWAEHLGLNRQSDSMSKRSRH